MYKKSGRKIAENKRKMQNTPKISEFFVIKPGNTLRIMNFLDKIHSKKTFSLHLPRGGMGVFHYMYSSFFRVRVFFSVTPSFESCECRRDLKFGMKVKQGHTSRRFFQIFEFRLRCRSTAQNVGIRTYADIHGF